MWWGTGLQRAVFAVKTARLLETSGLEQPEMLIQRGFVFKLFNLLKEEKMRSTMKGNLINAAHT